MRADPTTAEKDPRFVEAGKRGARRRWGPPRTVRLDELTPEQRDVVLALIEAQRAANAAAADA